MDNKDLEQRIKDASENYSNILSERDAVVWGAKCGAAQAFHQEGMFTDVQVRTIATEFFYWWYNAKGTNTEQAFDDWWKLNKQKL